MENSVIASEVTIQNKIHTIRGMQVMFDTDLAELYRVETKILNRAVKRNIDRFPEHFRFQLLQDEYDVFLRFQNGTLNFDIKKWKSQLVIFDFKDIGKKWFAFFKFDMGALEMLGRLS